MHCQFDAGLRQRVHFSLCYDCIVFPYKMYSLLLPIKANMYELTHFSCGSNIMVVALQHVWSSTMWHYTISMSVSMPVSYKQLSHYSFKEKLTVEFTDKYVLLVLIATFTIIRLFRATFEILLVFQHIHTPLRLMLAVFFTFCTYLSFYICVALRLAGACISAHRTYAMLLLRH